jgi:restriction system protein
LSISEIFIKILVESVKGILPALWPLMLLFLAAGLIKLIPFILEQRRFSRSDIDEIDKMDGLTFEKYLNNLFLRLGYDVERTRYVGDYGADLVLIRGENRIVVQAKRYKSKVGIKAIQEVVASKAKYNCNKAMVVTNSYYTKQAVELAKANAVELWDKVKLVNALLSVNKTSNIENIDNKVKPEAAATIVNTNSNKNNTQTFDSICVVCGKVVSDKVKEYCLANEKRFGGKIYCYDHQRKNVSI